MSRTYYPWCRVDLHIRFEDLASNVEAARGLDERKLIRVETAPTRTVPPAGGNAETVGGKSGRPVTAGGSLPSDFVSIAAVQPVSVVIEDNGFRTANTAQVRLLWKDAPFLSVMIRSALVNIFMGAVDADTFNRGLTDYLYRIDPRKSRRLLRFTGWVDSWNDQHGAGGEYIEVQARDFTALLLDAKLPPGTTISMQGNPSAAGVSGPADRLDNVVRSTVNILPALRGMRVSVVGYDANKLPRVSINRLRGGVTAKEANKAGSKKDAKASKGPLFEGGSYWDIITDLCISSGVIPRIHHDTIELAPPRVLYESKGRAMATGQPIAFQATEGGTTRLARRVVYGENLEGLKFNRKLGRHKSPTIAVVSFDPTAKKAKDRIVREVYPKRKSIKQSPGEAGAIVVKTVPVPSGITDRKFLAGLAEAIHEMMARNELGVSFSTRDLSSSLAPGGTIELHGKSVDPLSGADMLDLRSGDPVEVVIQPADQHGPARRFSDLQNWFVSGGAADAVTRLERLGFPVAVAQRVARMVQRGLPKLYRVRNVKLQFAATDGIQISVNAVNFIDVRADARRLDRRVGQTPATTDRDPVSPHGSGRIPDA